VDPEDGKLAVPGPSSARARAVMRGNKRTDTLPELRLRKALHRAGLRYRVDVAPVRGLNRRADIVFTRQRVAVFVDGCFWHGCPTHYRPSQSNVAYWSAKVEKNRLRDRETDVHLIDQGWTPVRIWQHTAVEEGVSQVREALRGW
jgi:DNA mismatch endonuclease, patch repair protein